MTAPDDSDPPTGAVPMRRYQMSTSAPSPVTPVAWVHTPPPTSLNVSVRVRPGSAGPPPPPEACWISMMKPRCWYPKLVGGRLVQRHGLRPGADLVEHGEPVAGWLVDRVDDREPARGGRRGAERSGSRSRRR